MAILKTATVTVRLVVSNTEVEYGFGALGFGTYFFTKTGYERLMVAFMPDTNENQ